MRYLQDQSTALFKLLIFIGSFILFEAAQAQSSFTNVRVSDPSDPYPEEVSIALNPLDHSRLAAGANLNALYRSSDGGMTWTWGSMTSNVGVYGDPCLTYDDSGVLYYAHLSGKRDSAWLYHIVVQRSSNNGLTWSESQVGTNPPTQQDKAWLSVDRSNTTHRGNVMTAWTRFDLYGSAAPQDSSHIFFSQTNNHGLSWWSADRIDDHGGDCLDNDATNEGAVCAAHPDGDILVAWARDSKIFLDRSTDGGATFGKDIPIVDQPEGWAFDVPGIYRANGFSMLACDAGNSKYRGNLYLMWSDKREGTSNIYMVRSSDKGLTWGVRTRVNTDTPLREHFLPSMALDETTGNIYIVFYDRRNYLDDQTDVYLARSTDGGNTFENIRISESAFVPESNVFFGDYIHIAAHDGEVHPIWMKMDAGILSVWTTTIHDTTSHLAASVSLPQRVNLLAYDLGSKRYSLAFTLPKSQSVTLRALDMSGKTVDRILGGVYGAGEFRLVWNAGKFPAGVYLLSLELANGENRTAKIVLK